jgi:Ca-activated chloride channel family protein
VAGAAAEAARVASSAPPAQLPPANLVFLVDVSGSMDEPAKLPLLKLN